MTLFSSRVPEGRESLARPFGSHNRGACHRTGACRLLCLALGGSYNRIVPELPDLTVVAEAFHAALTGRLIDRLEPIRPLTVRGTVPEMAALSGQRILSVRRRGKFMVVELDGDRLIVNPMLTGRFELGAPDAKRSARTAAVLRLGPRSGGPAADAAPWISGATWLPPDSASVAVQYLDAAQMGKVYVLPLGSARSAAGFDELGPDADDPSLTLDEWRQSIRRHPGELKNLLTNQAFVAGIGNAYSDEILHAARFLPNRKRSSLAAEEVDALYQAMRSTIATALVILRERVPPTFEKQVRDFLAVHNKGGAPCPRCGTRITQIQPGGFITSYCRGCQR